MKWAYSLQVIALVYSTVAIAENRKSLSLDGKRTQVVGDHDYEFKVTVDNQSGHVSVSTLKRHKSPPREMGITLFSDPDTSQTIQLKAMNLNDAFPHYQGELGPNMGSYFGIELKFETSAKTLKILRSIPPIPIIR